MFGIHLVNGAQNYKKSIKNKYGNNKNYLFSMRNTNMNVGLFSSKLRKTITYLSNVI